MLIHRRAPKPGTSRGPGLGHSEGTPGDPRKPPKMAQKPPILGGVRGGGPGGGPGGVPGGVQGGGGRVTISTPTIRVLTLQTSAKMCIFWLYFGGCF